jgi:hypothetical protein
MKRNFIVVGLFACAACGDQLLGAGDDSPNPGNDPIASAQIEIEDALVPSTQGTDADDLLAIVKVTTQPCVTLDDSFGGKFRGQPMDVVDLGGKDSDGTCQPGVLQIDLATLKLRALGEPVVEVFDAKANATVTLDADIMDTRTVVGQFSGTFVMCSGETVSLQWSNAQDIAGGFAPGRAAFHETHAACNGACAPIGTFSAELGAGSGGAALAFTVPKATALNYGGTGQVEFSVPGAERTGDAPGCDGAGGCSYHFTHPTINNATLDRAGCP